MSESQRQTRIERRPMNMTQAWHLMSVEDLDERSRAPSVLRSFPACTHSEQE